MFFLNLSLFEFLGLLSTTSAVVFVLYLLNRARRRAMVSTLRFWVQAAHPPTTQRRRRIQQPWSLVLQLLGVLCLLLAIAQPRMGSPERSGRNHVMILDTSSWMAARSGRGTLLDEAKSLALAYLRTLAASDRVMLVRADGIPTPATKLESDRGVVEAAIRQSRAGAAALDIEQALEFAANVQRLNGAGGEIVFIGAGRIPAREGPASRDAAPAPANLRVLKVGQAAENAGLRKIGVRRPAQDPGVWEIFVSVRNYGARPFTAPLSVYYGGAPAGSVRVQLLPGAEQEATFQLRTQSAGWVEARLHTQDALADDNRAVIELPEQRPVQVEVYSDSPDLLRPILSANPLVEAVYRAPASYTGQGRGKVVILDRFRPAQAPSTGAIWIEPASRVRQTVSKASITRFLRDHDLCAGLRTTAVQLESARVLTLDRGELAIAEVEAGPVIVARPATPRAVLLGFHPGRADTRYDLLTPLLFANILRWLEPEAFRNWELHASSVGAISVALDSGVDPERVQVIADDQQRLPYTVQGQTLRFFAGTPGTVRVITNRREQVYSLTLPQVGETAWKPPANARSGLPSRAREYLARDIWQWLAALGGGFLLAEWILYGRARRTRRAPQPLAARAAMRQAS
ncbi:MAG: VWA domain-containing protein [Acidobacteria bacterium]|nr:VWA domain-containing protein [Acidobacteriota bacterium]MBI3278631.1 VWA domain-containing protein [Acidobacteriota bacterium]